MNYRLVLKPFIDDLSAPHPPGGGSAGCAVFCMGVSLIEMAVRVSRYKIDNKTLPLPALSEEREKIMAIIDQDAQVFRKFLEEKDVEKKKEYLLEAVRMSDILGNSCCRILDLVHPWERKIKQKIRSDYYLGIECVKLALSSAVVNLKENNQLLHDGTIEEKIKQYSKIKERYKEWPLY